MLLNFHIYLKHYNTKNCSFVKAKHGVIIIVTRIQLILNFTLINYL